MNERMKALAVEADFMLCEDGHFYSEGQSQKITDGLQKFAELIVRECADILMKPEYAMNHPEELSDYNKGWVNGRLLGIEHIKDHFGIEE
jgi:hypothetical protein